MSINTGFRAKYYQKLQDNGAFNNFKTTQQEPSEKRLKLFSEVMKAAPGIPHKIALQNYQDQLKLEKLL